MKKATVRRDPLEWNAYFAWFPVSFEKCENGECTKTTIWWEWYDSVFIEWGYKMRYPSEIMRQNNAPPK